MQAIEMNAEVTDEHEIHIKLPDNIKNGTVKVIVMYNEELTTSPDIKERQFGQFKGKIHMADDFDDELPDSFWSGKE